MIDINDERAVRISKLEVLKHAGRDPYPARLIIDRTHTVSEALLESEDTKVSIAGRLFLKRDMGNLMFVQLRDESGQMQIVLKKGDLEEQSFKEFSKLVDVGDIIIISGLRFVTQKGEQSVLVNEWALLTKALRPLPDKHKGLADEETRLRKRYLDLLTDTDLNYLFRRKAIFWQSMRMFLMEEDFLEVETPVLENTAGGADAEPFVTHHNALDLDVYLRISMGELWQKRLMVAGFEKTFEIGRQFRNEGMSREHLQDYTQMEFYWAYADYEKSMELVERMYKFVIEKTFSTLTFDIGEFTDIDLSAPWQHIDYVSTIEEKTSVNVLTASEKEIQRALTDLHIAFDPSDTRGRLMDSLWKYCRKSVKGPVFLINLPVAVSPLAKRKQDNRELTERYQIIIAGSELGNGYSELNDPIDQAERFQEQAKMREAGDSEAQMYDTDFVEALEHGMPPTTGFGVSERLFSFLANRPIRECVLFPLMKPIEKETCNKET